MDNWKTNLLCPNFPTCHQDNAPLWLQWAQEPKVYYDQNGRVSGVTLYAYCNNCGQQYTGYVPVNNIATNWTKEGNSEQITLNTQPRPA